MTGTSLEGADLNADFSGVVLQNISFSNLPQRDQSGNEFNEDWPNLTFALTADYTSQILNNGSNVLIEESSW